MNSIKSFDEISARGKRTVGNGIAHLAAKESLKGFNFNVYAILNRILLTPYTVDTDSGIITSHDFIPLHHVVPPQGATHLTWQAGFARIDFTGNAGNLQVSNIVNLLIDDHRTD